MSANIHNEIQKTHFVLDLPQKLLLADVINPQ